MQEAHFEFDFLGTVYQGFYIKSVDSAEAVLRKLMEKDCLFGCDTETAGLPQYRGIKTAGLSPHLAQIRLFQIFDGKNSFVFDCFSLPIKMFKEFLETKDFVAHNALFDLGFLRKAGIEPKSFGCSYLATKLLFHVLYPTDEGLRAGLADVTKSLLGTDILKTLQLSDWSVGELTREQVEYAAIDAICVLKIAEKMVKGLKKYDLLNYYQLCKKAQYPISDIQLNGVKVDVEHHREMIAIWRDELYASKKEVLAITGLDDLTDHKLGSWLEKTLDPNTLSIWPRTDPEQGKPKLKTDAHTFADFSYLPIVVPVSKFKKMEKLTSSFGNSLLNHINPATNRIHSGYHICGARTGRLSSSKINMQQMPRDKSVRESFIAEEGNVLVYADLSQIELRVMAELSQDKKMLDAYRKGIDLHLVTASAISGKKIENVSYQERQMAKACFSGDTEILTQTGWVRFDKYNGQTPVAQYTPPIGIKLNPEAKRCSSRFNVQMATSKFTSNMLGEIKFIEPLGFKRFFNKKMLHWKDRNIDILATPDHEILYCAGKGILKKHRFDSIKDVRSLITSGWWNKGPFVCPSILARILSMFIADGNYTGRQIRFGFVKRRKYRRCYDLLKRVTDKVRQSRVSANTSTGIVTNIVCWDDELIEFLKKYVSKDKELSWQALNDIDPVVFLEEASFWDSHVIKSTTRDRVLFSTVIEQTADVMQAMAVTSGVSCIKKSLRRVKKNHRILHALSYRLNQNCFVRSRKETIKKSKKRTAYCVQVPSGNIVIRRNGKVCIQGNCNFGLAFGIGATKFSHYAKKSYDADISTDHARNIIDIFRETYPDYFKWQLEQVSTAEKTNYCITPSGKLRLLAEDNTYGASMNHPVQGGAAEVMLNSLIIVKEDIKATPIKLVNTVHDEIVLECPKVYAEKAGAILTESMIEGYLTVFPNGITRDLAECGVGINWADAKMKENRLHFI